MKHLKLGKIQWIALLVVSAMFVNLCSHMVLAAARDGNDQAQETTETTTASESTTETTTTQQEETQSVGEYKVSSPSICKVSASGKITGLKAGKTSVTITPKQAPSFAKTITITVTDTSLGKVTWGKCKRSSKTVQLQWKKVSGATSYQVYRFKGKKWVRVTTTKKTSYKYKKAPKNGSYKVRAVKSAQVWL